MKKERSRSMFPLDLDRVRKNVSQSTTEDLLDRATVYRAGMEDVALEVIGEELRSRGITPEQIEAHEQARRREISLLPDGTAVRCSFCQRPAVAEAWGWHWVWGLVPVFPRYYYYCSVHRPDAR
jgi:hypothetical protein